MTNAAQVQSAEWNGRTGGAWLTHQERLDRMLAPFGEAAFEAALPAPAEHVLDIGCGAGSTTLALARAIGPYGTVTGLDISEPLLARARARAMEAGIAAAFLLADAASHGFAPESIDLLFSRFGVMFFDDPAAAFVNLRRALKPDGRLAFVCWRGAEENDWVRLPMTAVRSIVPPQTPLDPDAPGPFSFGDAKRVKAILTDAGFAGIELAAFDRDLIFGSGVSRDAAIEDALEQAFEVGPLSRALADQPEPVRRQAAQAVRAAFAERVSGTRVVIRGAAWVVTAQAGQDPGNG